jgi:hypothetical protein
VRNGDRLPRPTVVDVLESLSGLETNYLVLSFAMLGWVDEVNAISTAAIAVAAVIIGAAEWRRFVLVRQREDDRTMREWRHHAAQLTVVEQDDAVTVTNTADVPFVRIQMWVYAIKDGQTGSFSHHHQENSFDLLPGESRTMEINRADNPMVIEKGIPEPMNSFWVFNYSDHDENRWWRRLSFLRMVDISDEWATDKKSGPFLKTIDEPPRLTDSMGNAKSRRRQEKRWRAHERSQRRASRSHY